MNFNSKIINGHYLVSSSSTGAMSLFSPAEYLAFEAISKAGGEDPGEVVKRTLASHGCKEEEIANFSGIFLRKLKQQGWFRNERIETEVPCLQVVYLTVTTSCNLSCSYCYIGDNRRVADHSMKIREVETIIQKIRSQSPSARVMVTGGEPLTHPKILDILDILESNNLQFSIATNANLIDESFAKKLKGYLNLVHVQVSLDGITPEVHSITRGNSYEATIRGINILAKYKVCVSLAPTVHEGNLHEILDIARFAYRNGGLFDPNHLRKFPHAPNACNISLEPDSLRNIIIETFEKIHKEFDHTDEPKMYDSNSENIRDTRCRYVCGNAWYNVDIDWNGDVYPCHLLREKEFILGNILEEDFPDILEKGRNSKTRLRAYEIPKCKECPFVATCAGGCRASAFYTKGTIAAEDEFCDILYKFEVDKLFLKKNISFHL